MNFKFNLENGSILQIGFGSVGQPMVQLYKRHFIYKPKNIKIIDMDKSKFSDVKSYSDIEFINLKVTRENYKRVLSKYLKAGDLLLDLAWYIDTLELINWCKDNGVLFVNTAVENWKEDECKIDDKYCQTLYTRQQHIQNDIKNWKKNTATAIITHGANPGWVSHATKIGIRDWVSYLHKKYPRDKKIQLAVELVKQNKYPEVAMILNIQAIHIAEKDTQISKIPREIGEFVNTWSPMGFTEEGTAPAELGWGTHEILEKGVFKYKTGPKNQVFFKSMGMNTYIKSYVPSGDIVGMIVRHEEAYSISHYLSVKDGNKVVYRPTVHYSYYPSGDAIASMYEYQANNYKEISRERVMKDEIISGKDELGVFMMSRDYGCWWIGSLLDIITARKLLPHQSATTVQIAPSVMSAIIYAFNHPKEGYLHPEDMDADEAMKYILPYLGEFVSNYVEWIPKNVDIKYKNSKDWIIEKLLLQLPPF